MKEPLSLSNRQRALNLFSIWISISSRSSKEEERRSKFKYTSKQGPRKKVAFFSCEEALSVPRNSSNANLTRALLDLRQCRKFLAFFAVRGGASSRYLRGSLARSRGRSLAFSPYAANPWIRDLVVSIRSVFFQIFRDVLWAQF